MNSKKIKKFRVSLALKVYSNFETEVFAKNEKDALSLASHKYEVGDYEDYEITEPDFNNSELDIDDGGIQIEEIEGMEEKRK